MNTVSFPLELYKKRTGLDPEKFFPDVPLIVCAGKCLAENISYFLLGFCGKLEKTYKYSFSDFEIDFLAKISDSNADFYFGKQYYTIPYNFDLILSQSNHRGIVSISSEFIFKDTLEKSYFEVKITFETEVNKAFLADISLFPDFLKEVAAADFADKILHSVNKKILVKKYTAEEKEIFGMISSVNALSLFKMNLSPLCADVFHIICHFYLTRRNQYNQIFVTADEILKIKGRKGNKHANGKTYGYTNKMRAEVEEAVMKLAEAGAVAVPAKDNFKFALMLNPQFFTEEKFLIELPAKILSYNHKSCLWERKLSELIYTFSEQKSLKIKYFISLMKKDVSSLKPSQIRDRFENAMDKLSFDGVIKSWQYKNINENHLSGKDWLSRYKNLSVEFKFT